MKKKYIYIISALIFFLGFFLIRSTAWLNNHFWIKSVDQIIFHLRVPLKGTSDSFTDSFIKRSLLVSVIATLGFYILIAKDFKRKTTLSIEAFKKRIKFRIFPYPLLKRFHLIIAIALLISSIVYTFENINLMPYLKNQLSDSTFIKDNYADPNKIKITFPEEKRNLIYIFLESMEVTYTSKELGGAFDYNYMPELTKLAEENISFSNTDKLGGPFQLPGTGWTIAAMSSQTSGLPFKVPIEGNSYNKYESFLPGVTSLGDILNEAGYNQTLMVGSDASFGGRDDYFTQHGNYEIWDYYTAIEEEKIDEDYHVWWGFEDSKLFSYAKNEIENLANQNEPFNFTFLTVNTHHVNGYLEDSCETNYQEQYPNVISCSSKRTMEFIRWIQSQDFYDNTTIVIIGDHLSMDPDFFKSIDSDYERTVYNVFINSQVTTNNTKNRLFSAYDMFPTTLASLGVTIEGNKLGIGTNLFSEEKTIIENIGLEETINEINKRSTFYNSLLLPEE